jgi:hypothetical protein
MIQEELSGGIIGAGMDVLNADEHNTPDLHA